MNIKRKMNTKTKTKTAAATLHSSLCCRHILITFVGMTLLIVNYGANTAQMSAEPQSSRWAKSDEKLSLVRANGRNYDNKKFLWARNEISPNFEKVARPETPMISGKENSLEGGLNVFNNSNTNRVNRTELESVGLKFRNPRFFGLFGSNFSLSYNLTLSTGNSVGNITVISPAPAPTYYYYAPDPSYPYYPYYNYYDPNAYNPYASSPQYYYGPNTGYVYYG